MLMLQVVRAPAPSLPRLDDPGVETWLDNDGAAAAYGGSVGGRHWMLLPGVGAFVFANDTDAVEAFPEDAASDALVEDSFRRIVLPMALQARGRQVLHASGVLGPKGVVALCAVSETGKSTLAFGLGSRGFQPWADDAVAFELTDDGVVALPLPFTLRLRPESAAFFGRDEPDVAGEPTLGEPAQLAAICVVERLPSADGVPIEIEPLDSVDAFPAVLTHAYCFSLEDDDRKRGLVQEYLELVTRVPVLRVRLREGLERLPKVLDAIAAAVR
jgi:hypothetical protein